MRAMRIGTRDAGVLAIALLASLFAMDRAVADTVAAATNGNTALGTAQPINEAPTLLLQQKIGNNSLANAQDTSPTYQAADVIGSIAAGHPSEFYSLPAQVGQTIYLEVTAKSGQATELLLYDPAYDLVAIASGNASDGVSSLLEFSVFTGSAGNWLVQVAGSPYASNPATSFFPYTLHVSSPITYLTDVLGTNAGTGGADYYAIAVNAGDNLLLNVSAGKPAKQATELLLYDENSDLVAIASGNAPDGSSSVISYTAATAGTWRVAVTGSPSVSRSQRFNYDLRVQGATGAGTVIPH
jgi:hypothetical protein